MTPQMIMRKPCCQMDLPKGIRIRNIFLLNEIQADRENSHQCAVAVGVFARFAAGCEVVAVAILIDGIAAGIPLIKRLAEGGICAMKFPIEKAFHDIPQIDTVLFVDARKGRKCHTAVIRPCTGGHVIGAVALHFGDGSTLPKLLSVEKLNGTPQCVPDNQSHHAV